MADSKSVIGLDIGIGIITTIASLKFSINRQCIVNVFSSHENQGIRVQRRHGQEGLDVAHQEINSANFLTHVIH